MVREGDEWKQVGLGNGAQARGRGLARECGEPRRARERFEHHGRAVSARVASRAALGIEQHRPSPAPAGRARSGGGSAASLARHADRGCREARARCCSSAAICVVKRRCSRIACARRRAAARRSRSSIRQSSIICSRSRRTWSRLRRSWSANWRRCCPRSARRRRAAVPEHLCRERRSPHRSTRCSSRLAAAARARKQRRRDLCSVRSRFGSAAYADLRRSLRRIAQATGASFGVLAEGAMPPVRISPAPCRIGRPVAATCDSRAVRMRDAAADSSRAYVLFGGVEPWVDALDSEVTATLSLGGVRRRGHAVRRASSCVSVAHVMLPIGTFAETSGTYVNLEGKWQSFAGAVAPRRGAPGLEGAARARQPAARAGLRLPVVRRRARGAARACAAKRTRRARYAGTHRVNGAPAAAPVVELNMYQVDALVRRAPSLQKTREGRTPAVAVLSGTMANAFQLFSDAWCSLPAYVRSTAWILPSPSRSSSAWRSSRCGSAR